MTYVPQGERDYFEKYVESELKRLDRELDAHQTNVSTELAAVNKVLLEIRLSLATQSWKVPLYSALGGVLTIIGGSVLMYFRGGHP